MSVSFPSFDQFVDPLLRVLVRHGEGMSAADAYEAVADACGISKDDRALLLPSGTQEIYKNRIGWAHDRLKRAGLSESPRRGIWRLTQSGRDFVKAHPKPLNSTEIERLAVVRKEPGSVSEKPDAKLATVVVPVAPLRSPEELIDEAVLELRRSVSAELLASLGRASPTFFERTVLQLLNAMGYGVHQTSLAQVGGPGDGGIDGIISHDRLGFEKVYVQAKRWQGNVGRPEIQAFFGALAGHRATKGVFITTSDFTREAQEYAGRVSDSLVLVNGTRLTQLMIDFGVGVTPRTILVPRVDSDFFEDA